MEIEVSFGERTRDAGEPSSRVGIMGGTFDPIHHGHLVAAEAVRIGLGLGSVVFVPANNPPHKVDRIISPASHRLAMVWLATLSNPCFQVSTMELDRDGVSYTIDTIKHLREEFGPQTELFFITGADAVLEIMSWKNARELLEMCQFVAVTRPGYSMAGLESLKDTLGHGLFTRIRRFEVPALAISSSDLRRMVRGGKSIRYLVPEAVSQYIEKNRLYMDGSFS